MCGIANKERYIQYRFLCQSPQDLQKSHLCGFKKKIYIVLHFYGSPIISSHRSLLGEMYMSHFSNYIENIQTKWEYNETHVTQWSNQVSKKMLYILQGMFGKINCSNCDSNLKMLQTIVTTITILSNDLLQFKSFIN